MGDQCVFIRSEYQLFAILGPFHFSFSRLRKALIWYQTVQVIDYY